MKRFYTITKRQLLIFFLFGFQILVAQKQILHDSILENTVNDLIDEFAALINKDIDSCLPIIDEMFGFSTENNYAEGLGISYGNYGIYYAYKGDQARSVEYFIKSAEIFEEINNDNQAAVTFTNIGVILLEQYQYEEAEIYFNKSLEYYTETGRGNGQTNYIGLGYISLETNDSLEETISNFKKAEEISTEKGDQTSLLTALSGQAATYIKFGKYLDKANDLLDKTLTIAKDSFPNDYRQLGRDYNYYGELKFKQGDFKTALKYNDTSVNYYKTFKYYKGLKDAYKIRKDILASLGRYKDSYDTFLLFDKLKDSLFQRNKLNQTVRMQTRFETEEIKRDKEVAEKNAEISALASIKNKNLFIGSAIIAGLILLSSLFYFSRIRAKKKAELISVELKETQKRLAIEKQYRDSELKALKAQMNPHFIFNALNSIQDYIVLNKKDLASDYLGKFADLIRNYLHFSDTGFISVTDEVHNLQLYLELEKLRFEEELQYDLKVEEDLNTEAIKIPTMLIQPYIENALKHGLLHKKDNRKLTVQISKSSDKLLQCVVEDNGIGREKSKEINVKRQSDHKSFALKATSERLDLLNYGKERKIGVEVMDLKENGEATGTKVILNIPIVK